MPTFSYTAVNQEGALVKGIVEAGDMDMASENISSKDLHIVDIRRSISYAASLRKSLLYRRIKRKDIIEFVNNVSLMLKAGVPLTVALSDIAETVEEKSFKDILLNVKRDIAMGASFSGALAEHRKAFPDILIRLTSVGEETGALDRSLSDVADHLQRIEDLVSAVKRALIYPVFAMLTTGGALLFWFVYVLPQVVDAFNGMGIKLPFVTKVLIVISNFIAAYWNIILGMSVFVFIIIKIMKKWDKTKFYIDLITIKIPIVKLLILNKLLTLFSEQLRILIIAGITIDKSLRIIYDMIDNEVFKVAISDIIESITAGNKISDSVKKHKLFPAIMPRMIDIGESSGSLDVQLDYLTKYFLRHLNDVAEKLGKMLEPIIIIVIGIIFLLIIVSILFPVYDLVTQIGV